MKAIIFPGQGSQKLGMGATLFAKYRSLTDEASDILGLSLPHLCLEGTEQQLKDTRYTQPALYVVGALAYLDYAEHGARASIAAGHSLGEIVALFAAGAFDFGVGLGIVKRRAELMANAPEGGMAAIVGLTEDDVRDVLATQKLNSLYVANLNSPRQVVIAGPRSDIADAEKHFKEAQGYKVLNVSGAFHTPYMSEARERFADHVRSVAFRPLDFPVVSNVTARPYAQDVRGLLTQQITSEVRWSDSIRYMIDRGTDEFVELGSGKVLTSLVAQIKRSVALAA